jgi:hypothetical protein
MTRDVALDRDALYYPSVLRSVWILSATLPRLYRLRLERLEAL